MNNFTATLLLSAVLLASIRPATASVVNVTSNSQVTVGSGDDLLFCVSSDDFSFGHGTGYPGAVQVLLGGMPLGGAVAAIPGTSGVYIPGIEFSGTLESQDGSISIPLTDPNATRLGLASGDMVLTPGSVGGGSYSGPIDLLSADVAFSSQTAAALFASGEFVIDLHNAGAPIAFGYPGSSMASDFSASLISPDGSRSMGGRVSDVFHNQIVATPEPGTIGLLLIGLTIICARLGKMRETKLIPCKAR